MPPTMRCFTAIAVAIFFSVSPCYAVELDRAAVTSLFSGITGPIELGPASGSPPAMEVRQNGSLLGYAFSTRAVSNSVGYSGKPLDIHVGLSTDGKIAGARLIEHKEPILVIGISTQDLEHLVNGLAGIDVRRAANIRDLARGNNFDHIAGATISSAVIRDAVIRAARQIAYSRGIIGGGGARAGIDRSRFETRSWQKLLGEKAIARRTIKLAEVAKQLGTVEEEPETLLSDLHVALLTPPLIGQNLLGRRLYEQTIAKLGAQDHAILIAADGLYSFKGTAWRRSKIFDRIQIVQDGKTIQLKKGGYRNTPKLAAKNAPEFREVGIFQIPGNTGFKAAKPWRLEFLVERDRKDGTTAAGTFAVDYQIPSALIQEASSQQNTEAHDNGPELWQQMWQFRRAEIVIVGIMLTLLAGILFFQDVLTRNTKLYRKTRLLFLTATFLFLGLFAGAQLSVVNVISFTQALLSKFRWEQFLLDPMSFILWAFVAVSLLFWGRGVFCGWLCPFGALQEILNAIARKLGIKQITIPWGVHERLWPIKYIAFLAILGASMNSVADGFLLAEIEPFKTVIVLKFMREWPFVLYALLIIGAGLFIERFFCRYLCPLGAGLAIPAKLRIFEWLNQRPQCGRECRICESRCTVQAISPIGKIIPNECIYCLRCQANYFDPNTCQPLKRRAARREGPSGTGAAE